MLYGLKLLNHIWENANASERETFKRNEKQWIEIMTQGEAVKELLENESFRKGLELAQARFRNLITELLKHNDREMDLKLKAEANNLISIFNGLYGEKEKAKEVLETNLRKLFGIKEDK